MTTNAEMPTTIKRPLMVGFLLTVEGAEPVEIPITNFSYHAALDDNDRPIADYVGVYHGVAQLKSEAGYFWKGLMMELTLVDTVAGLPNATSEASYAASYTIRFVELMDTTGPIQPVIKVEPVVVMVEKQAINTAAATNAAGELKPEWTITQYEETLSGERTAILMDSTGRSAKVVSDRAHQIVEISIGNLWLKNTTSTQRQQYQQPDRSRLIDQIEYSYFAQRFSRAITGVANAVVESGKVDLSGIAAPTYVAMGQDAPEGSLLDTDSPESVAAAD